MALTVTEIQQLYTAYLGRPVDQEGVDYWTDAELDLTIADLRFNLANDDQPEYVELYGDRTREELVTAIYDNMFGRVAEEADLDYWVNGEGAAVPANELQQLFIEAASDEDSAAFEAKVQADLEAYEAGDTSGLTEALTAYENAQQAVSDAETELSAALVAADDAAGTVYGVTYDEAEDEYTGFDAEADYVTLAEGEVLYAKTQLNNARKNDTDAELDAAVTKAQTAVNDAESQFDASGVQVLNEEGDVVTANFSEVFQVTDLGSDTSGTVSVGGYVTSDYANFGALGATKSAGYVDVSIDNTNTNGLVVDAGVVTVDNTDGGDRTVSSELTTALYTAAQLQARAANAEAKYEANVEANGDSAELAAELKDAISLYQNSADSANAALTTLTNAIGTYESAIDGVTDEDTLLEAESAFLGAVETANDAVFAGTDGASLLEDGARGDSVEALLTTLNTRNDLLVDWVGANLTDASNPAGKQGAFEAAEGVIFTGGATTLTGALDAQETREEQIQAVADAEAAFEAISAAAGEYETAVGNAADAEEELGYAVTNIETDSVLATDEADLFIFDAETAEEDGLGSDIFINGMESDDVLFLFGDYQLAEGEGDNNALEFFLTEVDGNAVLQIENTAFGSNDGTDGDFTTITLTGVAQADVSIEGSVVSIA